MRAGVVTAAAFGLMICAGQSIAQEGDGFAGLSKGQTDRVVDTLEDGAKACDALEPPYRPDCLQKAYSFAADVVGKNAAYWEAEVALTRVSQKLYGLVRQYGDADAPRGGSFFGTRYRAVLADKLGAIDSALKAEATASAAFVRDNAGGQIKFFEPVAKAIEANNTVR